MSPSNRQLATSASDSVTNAVSGSFPSSSVGGSSSSSQKKDPINELGLPSPLILGSGSFTRKLILDEMGINYQLLVLPVDEKQIGDRLNDNPHDLVLTLAKAKGDRIAHAILNEEVDLMDVILQPCAGENNDVHHHDEDGAKTEMKCDDNNDNTFGGWIILTADQVVTHDGTVLEKPESIQEAKDFVSRYAEGPPSTVGACVLTHVPTLTRVEGVDSATVHFQKTVAATIDGSSAGKDLVDRLVEEGAPVLSCAGGLMIEHPLVREHIDRIDGTEDSVMGLSKELVMRLLQEMSDKLKEC